MIITERSQYSNVIVMERTIRLDTIAWEVGREYNKANLLFELLANSVPYERAEKLAESLEEAYRDNEECDTAMQQGNHPIRDEWYELATHQHEDFDNWEVQR